MNQSINNIAINYKNNTKTIEEQQDIARKILKFLEIDGNTGCLAGGAPRNWHFKIPARDLDIYVCNPINIKKLSNYINENIEEATTNSSYACKSQVKEVLQQYSQEEKFDYMKSQIIKNVQSFNILGINVQFIEVDFNRINHNFSKFIPYLFESFDFGICKIACQLKTWSNDFTTDKNPGFYTFQSVDFIRDCNEKKLTLRVENIKQKNLILKSLEDRTSKRFEKIRNYFSDHEIDIILDKEAYIGK